MLIPYPELNLSFNEAQSLLSVETPWLLLDIEIDVDKHQWIKKIISDVQDKNYPNIDIHNFLESLIEFPLSIEVPRNNLLSINFAYNNRSYIFENILSMNKDVLTKHVNTIFLTETTQKYNFIQSNLPKNKNWEFDAEFIKSNSCIEQSEFYDPISAFQLIRRARLLHELKLNKKNELIDVVLPNMLIKNEFSKFHGIVTHLLMINLFVTSNCSIAIETAISAFPFIADEIKEFLRNEKGHDKLLTLSLNKLGVSNLDAVSIYIESISQISSLYFSSKYSPFSLLNIIDAFEGIAYENTDPLVELIKRSPWPEAAIGIERHFNINKKGEHNSFASNLLYNFPPLSAEELDLAIRLCEIHAESDNRILEMFIALAKAKD